MEELIVEQLISCKANMLPTVNYLSGLSFGDFKRTLLKILEKSSTLEFMVPYLPKKQTNKTSRYFTLVNSLKAALFVTSSLTLFS